MDFQKSFLRNLQTGILIAITAMVVAKFLNAMISQGTYRIVIGHIDMMAASAGAIAYALYRIYYRKISIRQKEI